MLSIIVAAVNVACIIKEKIPIKFIADEKCLNDILLQVICETGFIEHKKERHPVN